MLGDGDVLATSPVNSIERRDKLGTGGFTKAIEFFFLFSKSPRNELITTFDNCSLASAAEEYRTS